LTVLEEVDGGEERAHDGVGERGAPSDEVEARLLMDAEYAPHCLVESRWNRKRRLPLRSKQLLFVCTARALRTEDFGTPSNSRASLSNTLSELPPLPTAVVVAAHPHRPRSHSPVNKGGGTLFWLAGQSLDLSPSQRTSRVDPMQVRAVLVEIHFPATSSPYFPTRWSRDR
jgi:hypothetical protein